MEEKELFDTVLNEWLAEVVYNTEDWIHIKEHTETKLKVSLYDQDTEYIISCTIKVDGSTYMGGFSNTRKKRAGESWHRGSDYPDGPIEYATWSRIKNAIIQRNLEKLSEHTYEKEGT